MDDNDRLSQECLSLLLRETTDLDPEGISPKVIVDQRQWRRFGWLIRAAYWAGRGRYSDAIVMRANADIQCDE
jgi:hypothetical protein